MPIINFRLPVAACPQCCVNCPTDGSVDVVNSTYTGCGCVQGNDGNWYQVTAHTGITGAHTLPWVTSSFFGTIGTATLQKYTAEGCATPDGDPEETDVTQEVTCDEETGELLNIIRAANGTLLGQFSAFVGNGQFDEEMTNTIDCTTPQGGPEALFLVDTSTVSITP